MSDKLRAAAKAALNMLNDYHDCLQAANILRVGLSEPAIKESLTTAEQEPVAWMWDQANYQDTDVRGRGWHFGMGLQHPNNESMTRNVKALYTAPPRREWVSLTDDEIDKWNIVGHESLREFVRSLEAKLKDKNA